MFYSKNDAGRWKDERYLLSRCIFAARRSRTRWKYDRTIEASTSQGRNFAKNKQTKTGLVLTGYGTVTTRRQYFVRHWTPIMVGTEAQTPEEFLRDNAFGLPTVLPSEAVAGDLMAFVDVVNKQREGRAGGEDGMVAEFVKRLPTEAKEALYHQLVDTLRGAQPQPAHWRRASVSLTPKLLHASLPDDFRPITVLSVSVTLAAMPYLVLRKQRSRGFRASFQAAQVHRLMPELATKHHEWGTELTIIKLDIAKAYDALRWQSIEDEFRDRDMPNDLRCAYWRLHAGRELCFRTGDTTIEFVLRPNQDIPQGSPESPAVYAAVIEGLLDKVERRLHRAGLPAGLPLCSEGDATEVEDYKHSRRAFQPDDTFAVNFADDTYVLSRATREAEYTTAVIRQEYARANQMLHPKKFQALTTSTTQPIQMWDGAQLKLHEAGQPLGEGRTCLEHIPVVKAMVVLGSVISFEEPTEAPLQARKRASWKTFTECRGQLLQRTIPLAKRIKLLESTVLASFMWGLESVVLHETAQHDQRPAKDNGSLHDEASAADERGGRRVLSSTGEDHHRYHCEA